MLGYAFMGKAHSNAYRTLPYMAWPPPYVPKLVAIAGRNEEAVSEAAQRYGFEDYVTDWRELVGDDRVQVFDNSGPNNLHTEPSIAAAEAGKHVICEKPLGRDAGESYDAWSAWTRPVSSTCAPSTTASCPPCGWRAAIVESGDLGQITHFRGSYLQEWGATDDEAWRFDKALAGSGALGDLGAHVIDLARYLVGEIESVAGTTATFKHGRDVDDAFESVVTFDNGAVGTIEATRFAAGRKNAFTLGDQRDEGSIAFDLERLNELQVHIAGSSPARCRRRAFATCSCPRPTTPSGSGGGPTGTSSAGSTPSSTRSTTC